KIAVAEVFHIATGECFPLAITAPWVGIEHKVSNERERRRIEERLRPGWKVGSSRPSVRLYHHRITLLGIVVPWIEQPALHAAPVTVPVNPLGLTPSGLHCLVDVCQFLPLPDGACPDFRRLRKRLANYSRSLVVIRQRCAVRSPSPSGDHLRSIPQW